MVFIFGYEFVAFVAFSVFILEDSIGIEVGLGVFFLVVGLELDERLYVASDLSYHEVQFLDML